MMAKAKTAQQKAEQKINLILSDENIRELIDLPARDGSATQWLQRHYRTFRTVVQ